MNLKLYDQSQFLKGGRTQEIIWVEELGELQHEITKSLRGMPNKTHLVEEFADVLICLEQLKIKYNISDEQLQEWIDYKYNRNCRRLEQENDMNDDEKKSNYISEYNIRGCSNCPISGFIVDCEDVDCEFVIKNWNEMKERRNKHDD